jgi:hypothetical protein
MKGRKPEKGDGMSSFQKVIARSIYSSVSTMTSLTCFRVSVQDWIHFELIFVHDERWGLVSIFTCVYLGSHYHTSVYA